MTEKKSLKNTLDHFKIEVNYENYNSLHRMVQIKMIDRQIERQMDGWMDGWMDGQIDWTSLSKKSIKFFIFL